MARLRRHISALVIAASLLAMVPCGYAKGWETIRTEQAADARVVVKDTEIEIRASRGMIIITTSRPVQVKIYTILGQIVAQDSLQAGTFRLPVNTHGVYLVKIGEITCKVAV